MLPIVPQSGLCHSVMLTLVHPAKGTGRTEMPFGRDTHVVPSNMSHVLDSGPSPHRMEIFGGIGTPVHSDATYRRITLALVQGNTVES